MFFLYHHPSVPTPKLPVKKLELLCKVGGFPGVMPPPKLALWENPCYTSVGSRCAFWDTAIPNPSCLLPPVHPVCIS